VRLGAEQDNLLAAWSWAIGSGHVNTAFQMLAGFAPTEVWTSYPMPLPGEAALGLPGATEHPGYPLALAVSALFASNRADVNGTQELSRQAADANAPRPLRPGRHRRDRQLRRWAGRRRSRRRLMGRGQRRRYCRPSPA